MITTSCYPLVHRGPAAVVRLDSETTRTTQESLHVALTVVNRSSEEIWVIENDGGPTVEFRDATGNERCVRPSDPSRVVAAYQVLVQRRLARGASVTLRRTLALRELANCGPGTLTMTVGAGVIRPMAPGKRWRLTRRARLTIVS